MPANHRNISLAVNATQLAFGFRDDSEERWSPIDDWPEYEVSDRGRARSWRFWGGKGPYRPTIAQSPHLLTPRQNRDDTVWIWLTRDSKPVPLPLHRVVLEAFVGPRPYAHDVHYRDGNPANCDIRNLSWRLPPEFAKYPDERWLTVDDWDGIYEISDLGRIRTWSCHHPRQARSDSPRLMSFQDVHGYKAVRFGAGLKGKGHYVHRLVLEVFVGSCPDGMECRHLDGDRSNNRLDNLQWGTKSENEQDKFRHGTRIRARPILDPEPILFFDNFIPMEAIVPWECWKPIEEHLGYEISNHGRVGSYWAVGRSDLTNKRTIRAAATHDSQGHRSVMLRQSAGKGKKYYIHRLVLKAFSPQPDDSLDCRHLNGDASDNRLSNLRWGTRLENIRDRSLHGTDAKGEKSHLAKLKEFEVRDILGRLANGESPRSIAKDFNVSRTAIYGILSRKTWRHVTL